MISGETCTAQTCTETTDACEFEDPCDTNSPPPYCFEEEDLGNFDPCDKNSDGDIDADAPPFCGGSGGGTATPGDCCKPNPSQGCDNFGELTTTADASEISTCVIAKDNFCGGIDEDDDGDVDFGEWDGPCVALAHECLKERSYRRF